MEMFVFRSLLQSLCYFQCKFPSRSSCNLKSFIIYVLQQKYRMLLIYYFVTFDCFTSNSVLTQQKKQTCTNNWNTVTSISWLISIVLHKRTFVFYIFMLVPDVLWKDRNYAPFCIMKDISWSWRSILVFVARYLPDFDFLLQTTEKPRKISTCLVSGLQNTDTIPF